MSPIAYGLPGVFQGQAFNAVNGSLWTLPYEIVAYLGLLALGVASLIRSRILLGLFVSTAAVVSLGVTSDVVKISTREFNGLTVKLLLWLALWFLGGACLALYRNLVVQRLATGAAAVCVCAVGAAMHQVLLFAPALCVLIVFLGTFPSRRVALATRFGDPSYGLYLYAFPVQQVLVKTGVWHRSPWVLFGTASLVTAAVAFASWHFIEHPANKLRHRFASGQKK
jgi:peptidoglycan/LPS O-acetylase OafA/YrhL